MNESKVNPYQAPPTQLLTAGRDERRQQASVVLSMYLGYAMFMVLRMAPAPVSNAIINAPSLGVDIGDWGRIMAMGTAGAIVGKFVAGWAADFFGGRITFAAGLLFCSLGIAAFSVATSVWMFQTAFFVALMAKSAGWPGMTRIVGQSFHPTEFGRVWGVLSTSSRVGTIIATFGLGILVATVSWPTLLLVASGVGLVVAVAFNVSQKSAAMRLHVIQSAVVVGETAGSQEDDEEISSHPLDGLSLQAAVWQFCLSVQFWLIVGSLSALTIMWDFLLFLPIFLKDTVGMSDGGASMTASAFPIGSFISVLAGGFVFDLLSRRTTAWLMGGLLLIATGCIGLFYQMQFMSVSDSVAVGMSVVLLFIFGLCIAPCYYIPMSVFSIQFGGPRAGFLVAVLDAVAFFANFVFYWFAGEWAEQSWTLFLSILGAVAFISAILTFAFMLGEAAKDRLVAATPVN